MPTTIPCLWFDGQAEQAVQLYTSVFPNSTISGATRYGPDGPGREGSVMTVDFTLDGRRFVGLNGGPQFRFTETVSFQIPRDDQHETTTTGRGWARAASTVRAAGSRTASGCPGR